MTADQLETRIRERLTSVTQVRAMDLTGGGDHWRMSIVAGDFRGLSPVEQHQLIYRAVDDWMKDGSIHALSLETKAPVL